MVSKKPHILIVGAGIVGASLAYHLSGNARVTLIDKAPGCNGVTKHSFGWLVGGATVPKCYFDLRQQAIREWRKIDEEFRGRLKVNWCGALSWHKDFAETRRIVNDLSAAGSSIRIVYKDEIKSMEPALKEIPEMAAFAKDEGAINPVMATEIFINAAVERGADIQFNNEVLSFITIGSHVKGVISTNGKISGDLVVITAGTDSALLCNSVGVKLPVWSSPAILLQFKNDSKFVNRIISNPLVEIRAVSNNITLAAEDYINESAENNVEAIAQRTLNNIRAQWGGTDNLKLANVAIGDRPMPTDGLPLIGRLNNVEGLYISFMHTAVTLAPIIGRLVAQEIISGVSNRLLSPYNPTRF